MNLRLVRKNKSRSAMQRRLKAKQMVSAAKMKKAQALDGTIP
jgi:hypothetical protein